MRCVKPYLLCILFFVFFFNDTATTEIYTLSLHDALPICPLAHEQLGAERGDGHGVGEPGDRKSTRLNSSHANISYAVFCLKKKKKIDEMEQNGQTETKSKAQPACSASFAP